MIGKRTMQCLLLAMVIMLVSSVFIAIPGMAKTKLVIGLPGGINLHPPEMLDLFRAENPDIEVEELRVVWNEFLREKLPVMIATGIAPDVWYGESGRSLEWRFEGVTADLTRFVERDLNLDDYFFLDAARDPRTGEWTGIPSDFQVTALYYNTNHLLSRGIAYPNSNWTTDDLIDAAEKLTVPGAECPVRYGFNLQQSSITSGWMLWPRLLGAKILSPDRTESRLTDPKTVDAFDYMHSLIYEKNITPVPGQCSGYSMANGSVSMQFGIYSHNQTLASSGMDAYDVSTIPKSPSGHQFTTAVPNVWVINDSASADVQEAAWRWIKFQIGEEAQRIRMRSGGGVIVNRNVNLDFLTDPGPPSRRQVFLESYAFADTLEENAVWTEYRGALSSQLAPLWRNSTTAQAATMNAHEVITAIFRDVYENE